MRSMFVTSRDINNNYKPYLQRKQRGNAASEVSLLDRSPVISRNRACANRSLILTASVLFNIDDFEKSDFFK